MTTVAELIRERFGDLTHIQKIAIPKILSGENTIIIAPTGSGKTECALLPVLEKIEGKKQGVKALYITPLRSLNRDLYQRFDWWCERLGVSHEVRTGDTTQYERTKQRKNPPQIMLTTPESLQALLLGRVMREHLKNIEFIIVDEVHDILDNKRGSQLSLGLERLEEIAKFKRIALSATIANEEEAARLVFGFRSYAIAQVGRARERNVEIKHVPNQEERILQISELAKNNRALIFANTRSTAEEISADLKEKGAPIGIHHGSLSKEVRISAEEEFKQSKIRSLVSTSSLELGIDIGDIDLVVQYGSPHQVFRLIQRVGRSGHSLSKIPHGIIFTSDLDDYLEAQMIKILSENLYLEYKLAQKGALDVIAHQIVGICFDRGQTDLRKIHEILSRSYAYDIGFEKLKKVALQLYAEGIIYFDDILDETGNIGNAFIKNAPRAREYYYSNVSTIPREKKYLLKNISSNSIIASLDEEFVMNLESGSSFLCKGTPWIVVDMTESEVLVDPSSALDIAIPEWTGEDIPISYEVAKGVGELRKAYKKDSVIADEKTIVVEMVEQVIILHCCFGTKINDAFGRIISHNLSKLIGESVRAVNDAYRIMIKLPFPVDKSHVENALNSLKSPKRQLELSLENSMLLKSRFIHVGRLFGLLKDDAIINHRFIDALRNSVVYEETLRSIFSKYFDLEGLEKIANKIDKREIKFIFDKRASFSYFGKIGIEHISSSEAIGEFEPRKAMVNALKERTISKTVLLKCLSCDATRYLHIAGHLQEGKGSIICHKCNTESLTMIERDDEKKEALIQKSSLIRSYGILALIAFSVYGIGVGTAQRVLKKLHPNEESFYLDLLNSQKTFIKNKKYWKI